MKCFESRAGQVFWVVGILAALLILSSTAYGGSKRVSSYTHPACEDNPMCGLIAYANGGGYVVKSVTLEATGDQPSPHHPKCSSVDKRLEANLAIGQYHTFTVPAHCYYKLKIKISLGDKKKRYLRLTPGCGIVTISKGTTTKNNSIKVDKVKYHSHLAKGMDNPPGNTRGCGKK